jgi:hypothetical protein
MVVRFQEFDKQRDHLKLSISLLIKPHIATRLAKQLYVHDHKEEPRANGIKGS